MLIIIALLFLRNTVYRIFMSTSSGLWRRVVLW